MSLIVRYWSHQIKPTKYLYEILTSNSKIWLQTTDQGENYTADRCENYTADRGKTYTADRGKNYTADRGKNYTADRG